jgi:CDP-4-dehydro-6-deoxyglucose reductase, E1
MANYPLAISTWDECEINALHEVIDTGMFTMGKRVKDFENAFSSYIGSSYAVMVNSGSSANLLATAALFYKKNNSLRRGDEIIVPALSWPTTYAPLHQYGLKLKFVDIDLCTLNYDLNALKNAVSDKTRAIMVVNILGNPNDFRLIKKIIGDRNIIIIEDNCESMGAEYESKQTGTWGHVGTFSMFFSHHISTMEGGVIVTDDEETYQILLALRAHGWTRELPQQNHIANKSDNWFEKSWHFVLPGYNLRPTELQAAVGIEQLRKLPEILEARQVNAKLFVEKFTDHPYFLIQQEIGKSSWFAFSLVLHQETKYQRKQIIDLLVKNNIECRPVIGGNFLNHPVAQYMDCEVSNSLTNADWVDKNGFMVGNGHLPLENHFETLEKILALKNSKMEKVA